MNRDFAATRKPDGNRRKKWPFFLVASVLGMILLFVAYPVQKIFLGGSPFGQRASGTIPQKGTVGYLKVEEGYRVFGAHDRRTLELWEKTIMNPDGLSRARAMVREGQVVSLLPNTSVVSVDPVRGALEILSGAQFGQTLYVSMKHVRFIVLHR